MGAAATAKRERSPSSFLPSFQSHKKPSTPADVINGFPILLKLWGKKPGHLCRALLTGINVIPCLISASSRARKKIVDGNPEVDIRKRRFDVL